MLDDYSAKRFFTSFAFLLLLPHLSFRLFHERCTTLRSRAQVLSASRYGDIHPDIGCALSFHTGHTGNEISVGGSPRNQRWLQKRFITNRRRCHSRRFTICSHGHFYIQYKRPLPSFFVSLIIILHLPSRSLSSPICYIPCSSH